MKFGAHLSSVLYPEWRFYYMDYDATKKKLKQMAEHGQNCPQHIKLEFIDFLDSELQKVVSFQSIKSGELNSRAIHCETIINNIIDNPTSTPRVTRIARVEEELGRMTIETNELAKFARLNYTGFLKAVKKHDKHTSFQLKPMFIAKLNATPFFRENFDPLILKLSKLYDTVRNGGRDQNSNPDKNAEAGGSQSFIRKTTKYWVHPDNVTEVKLCVLKNLPVLVFGSAKEYDPAITSIYFDNDQFELYKGRLEKTEAAQAIRLRWYGSINNQEIFVERKTHREDWTGEKSVKERFSLKEKYVNAYCNGSYSMDKQIEKLRDRGAKSDKELAELTTLALEIQHAMVHKKILPMMRTFYNRTAFQLPGDARVRISLDTELTMIREDNFDNKNRSGTNWRRMDIGTDWPFTQLDETDVHRFPYAVLEVKLQTLVDSKPPDWVTQLVTSHLVEEVPKFSKFIHGCATLLENRLSLLPFWLPQMTKDIRKPVKPLSPSQPHQPTAEVLDFLHASSNSGEFLIEEGRVRKGKGKARLVKDVTASIPGTSSTGTNQQPPPEVPLLDEEGSGDDDDELTGLITGQPNLEANDQVKAKGILGQIKSLMQKLHVRESRNLHRHRSPPPVPSLLQLPGPTINSLIPATVRNKRILIPVRVEPKVFFANERTFLAWMNFSSMIAGLALGLLNFGDRVGQIAGIVFTLNAMLIMAYGLYLFLWRAEQIRNRLSGPYDDRAGPSLVVASLFCAMVINFYLKLVMG